MAYSGSEVGWRKRKDGREIAKLNKVLVQAKTEIRKGDMERKRMSK